MVTNDPEEKKLLTEAEHVANMLSSNGWAYAKARFDEKILDLQNIHNIDMEKPDTLNIQLAARVLAVTEMMSWMKGVYGFVEQQVGNANKAKQHVDPIFDRGGQ